MNRQQTICTISLIISLVGLIIGLVKMKENLVVPATFSTLLLTLAIFETTQNKYLKEWVCIILCIGLTINILSSFITTIHYTPDDWIDFYLVTPSFIFVSFVSILLIIGYFNIRLDHVMLAVFTLFMSLSTVSAYAGLFLFTRVLTKTLTDEESKLANYYLDASFAVVLLAAIISIFIIDIIIRKKKIKLITSKYIVTEEK
ncbi:MAG: hypothetical protein RBR05_03215 [Candidatus Methanomethylophilaceae archaeon]|nr:hypothetical protein [Candidatus Methanomethylophilaceae archaeon]MDY0224393.1 hypothetical protein [Candidatus Methanomethylophilaceae archaeon]